MTGNYGGSIRAAAPELPSIVVSSQDLITSMPAPRRTSGHESWLRILFDSDFESFLTPRFTRARYKLNLVLLSIVGAIMLIAVIAAGVIALNIAIIVGVAALLIGVILVPSLLMISLIMFRVRCEKTVAFYQLVDDIRSIRIDGIN